jgi:hypothetical protein
VTMLCWAHRQQVSCAQLTVLDVESRRCFRSGQHQLLVRGVGPTKQTGVHTDSGTLAGHDEISEPFGYLESFNAACGDRREVRRP